ncbi:MAG: NTP transferase domain-containing protein [Phycisphaerae bacterium]|nr:NTP transferase domain-containing protein [Phycisphaerae bacterium]
MPKTAAIILAAGKSTRMITDLPKVMHEVCGRPMLAWVIDACRAVGIDRILVVVGYHKEVVINAFPGQRDLVFVEQVEQKGTGNAVSVCQPHLDGCETVLVLCGDGPLVRPTTLKTLMETHVSGHSAGTLATAVVKDPTGYGRIIRDSYGNLQGIVEQADCTVAQKEIHEINPSYYCFQRAAIFESLAKVQPNNIKKEYYLTDAVKILIEDGRRVVAISAVEPDEVYSINSRQQLAQVSQVMEQRIQDRLMSSGVTIVDPSNTWIDARAEIGKDTIIYPFTYIHGRVKIGRNCSVGPFAYLRDGTVLEDDVVIGVFTEVKNSTLCSGARARHHSYLGDATFGKNVNVGTGTITANFDGKEIHRTEVGDNVYLGSGSILIAPLHVKSGVQIAPGTVVEDGETPGTGK